MNMDTQEPDSSCCQEGVHVPSLPQPGSNSGFKKHGPEVASASEVIQDGSPRPEYRWSKAARDLVRANMNAYGPELSSLITRLVEESGYPRWACRRFVRRLGVRSKRPQRLWTTQEQQRLLKLLDLHPVNEIAKLLRRSRSSVWHMLQRLGANAKMGKDSFTKYTLAVALHVRPEKVEEWINRGWLKAREVGNGRGKQAVIDAEEFCEFCRKHTRDVVGNRLSKERLDFVYHFAFPPSHAELLPVRESKKERSAYAMQLREEQDFDKGPTRLGPNSSDEDIDELDRIA